MSRSTRLGACAAFLAALLAVGTARADPAPAPRVIVVGRPSSGAASRMRAELEALGWQVFSPQLRPPSASPSSSPESNGVVARSRDELEVAARGFDAAAIVEVDDEAIYLWVIDAAGHARPVDVIRIGSEDVTTLRSAEIVRAAVENRLRTPLPPEARATPSDTTHANALSSKIDLGIGPQIVLNPGYEIGPAGSVLFTGRYHLGSAFSIGAFASVPVISGKWRLPEGTTELTAWIVGVGPTFTKALGPVVELHAGAGIAVAVLHASLAYRKHGVAAYVDISNPVTALPFAEFGMSVRLSPRVKLGFGAFGAVAVPRAELEVRAESASAVMWGRPLLGFSATLQIAL